MLTALETCDSNPAMTRLAAVFSRGYVSQVPLANVASDTVTGSAAGQGGWEDNIYRIEGVSSTNKELLKIAYGKDGSGNPHYVLVSNNDTNSLFQVSATNFYSKQHWTEIVASGTGGTVKQNKVLWGNNAWVSVGNLTPNKVILRSTNGTSWSAISVKTLLEGQSVDAEAANYDASLPAGKEAYTASKIAAITSDGNGTWWFGGGSQIYKSTDNGATWAFHVDLSSLDLVGIRDMAFTNNTLVVMAKFTISGGHSIRIVTAAASDTTDWGTPALTNDGSPGGSGKMLVDGTDICAAGNGRVICIDTGNAMSFDVNGKTATRISNRINISDDGGAGGTGNCTGIATDGEGNWYISTDGFSSGGDLVRSTDNGANWSAIVNDIENGGDRDMHGLAVDRYLPL